MRTTDYVRLTKPKVSALVILAGLAGMVASSPSYVDYLVLAKFLFFSYLVVGGCGAVNMYLDRDVDGKMNRTASRPVPSGRIRPETALVTGVLMIAAGLALAWIFFNWLTMLFTLLGVIIYVFVYTIWLKRRSPWNIVIGGAAGSCAPLAGWAALTGSVGIPALILAVLIFLWTPGHFWGLAIRASEQYRAARIPMLPVVVGEERAAKLASLSNAPLLPVSLLFLLSDVSLVFLLVAGLAGFWLLYESVKLYVNPDKAQAWRVFKVSSPYLSIICIALIVDGLF